MSEEEGRAERRQHQRVAVRLRADVSIGDDLHPVPFVTEDVSIGGTRLRGREVVVEDGASVLLALSSEERVVAVEAEVLETKVILDTGTVELRLRFGPLSDARRRALMLLLEAEG